MPQTTLDQVPEPIPDPTAQPRGIPLNLVSALAATDGQNPQVEFDYVTNGAEEMTVVARDTSGATWQRRFPIGPAG